MKEPDDNETEIASAMIDVIMDRISPLLQGQPREVQGGVLGECLARWLAGHPDHIREKVLQIHINYVRELLPRVEREIFAGGHHPGNKGRH
jgi:hypothetical protein